MVVSEAEVPKRCPVSPSHRPLHLHLHKFSKLLISLLGAGEKCFVCELL